MYADIITIIIGLITRRENVCVREKDGEGDK